MLCMIAVIAIFAIQNAIPIEISFLLWQFRASLAVVLFLTVFFGMIVGIVAASLFRLKSSRKKLSQGLKDSVQR